MNKLKAVVAATMVTLSATHGLAISACDGTPQNLTFRSKGDSYDFRLGGDFNVGDTLTISIADPTAFSGFSAGGLGTSCRGTTDCNGFSATVDSLDSDRFNIFGSAAGAEAQATFTCSNVPPEPAGPTKDDVLAESNVVGTAASASTTLIDSAVGLALDARGSGGPLVTRNGVMLSTAAAAGQAADAPVTVWAMVQGRNFSGEVTGDGGELTLGVDRRFGGETYVGALLSYGKYDIAAAGTDYATEALSIGTYFSTAISERYAIEGFAALARPQYEAEGNSYSSERLSYAVRAKANYTLAGLETTSHVGLEGYGEKLPDAAIGGARTIRSTTGTIGLRINVPTDGAIRPYVSVAADAIRFEDGETTRNSVSPSFGAGLEMSADMATLQPGWTGAISLKALKPQALI